jgi:hypothetical protein
LVSLRGRGTIHRWRTILHLWFLDLERGCLLHFLIRCRWWFPPLSLQVVDQQRTHRLKRQKSGLPGWPTPSKGSFETAFIKLRDAVSRSLDFASRLVHFGPAQTGNFSCNKYRLAGCL